MKKGYPKIEEFLEFADPENKLDRKKVVSEILAVTFLATIKENLDKLPEESRKAVEKNLAKSIPDIINSIAIFEKNKMLEQLKVLAIKYVNSLTLDYYNSHIDLMEEKKKSELFKKFPSLKELSSED